MRRIPVVAAAGLAAAILSQPALTEGQAHRIEMKEAAFAPAEVTVCTGDSVE